VITGEAGADRRGLWINDKDTGTRVRLGEVGMEMAMTLAKQGNMRAAHEAMSKPHVGLWFSKEF
jgi:hypothetical protein